MSLLAIVIVAIVIGAVLAAIAWFGRDELVEVGGALWTAWCFLFTLGWRIRSKLRNTFAKSALAVLMVASFYLSIEFALVLVHKSGLFIGKPVLRLGLAVPAEMPEIPIQYEIASLVLAVLMFRHHWKEWKIARRQSAVPQRVEGLLIAFNEYLKDGGGKDPSKRANFLDNEALGKIKALMDTKTRRNVAISIMEEARKGAPLAVTFTHPPTAPIDKTFTVPVGKGGAGKAYDQKVPIYIPSIRHLVGINGETLRSVGVTYEPSADKKNFRSLLSVPVMAKANVIAVLTFSSRRRGAFDPEDFEIARVAAAFIAMLY
jgi:hypothetical protein